MRATRRYAHFGKKLLTAVFANDHLRSAAKTPTQGLQRGRQLNFAQCRVCERFFIYHAQAFVQAHFLQLLAQRESAALDHAQRCGRRKRAQSRTEERKRLNYANAFRQLHRKQIFPVRECFMADARTVLPNPIMGHVNRKREQRSIAFAVNALAIGRKPRIVRIDFHPLERCVRKCSLGNIARIPTNAQHADASRAEKPHGHAREHCGQLQRFYPGKR